MLGLLHVPPWPECWDIGMCLPGQLMWCLPSDQDLMPPSWAISSGDTRFVFEKHPNILTKHEKYCLKKCLRKHCCGAGSPTTVAIDPSEWDQGSWRKIQLSFNFNNDKWLCLSCDPAQLYRETNNSYSGIASVRACRLLGEEQGLQKAGCNWFKEAPVHLKKQGKENRNQITSRLWWWNLRGSRCVDGNLNN